MTTDEVYSRLKEADAMLRTAKLILAEAVTLRKQGLRVQAQAYQLASEAWKGGKYAQDND